MKIQRQKWRNKSFNGIVENNETFSFDTNLFYSVSVLFG